MIKRNIYWFDCNFLLNVIIHTTYKMIIANQNIALVLKLVDSPPSIFNLITKKPLSKYA